MAPNTQSTARLLFCVLVALCSNARAETSSFEYLSSARARDDLVNLATPVASAAGNLAGGANSYAGATFAQSQVPEPDAYLQILAGLGLFGFMARRRFRGAALV